jgi:uncharacterized protein (DUF1499 family)
MRLRQFPVALSGLAAALLLLAGPLVRLGAFDFRTGFTLLRWAAYFGLAAAALAVLLLPSRSARGGRGVLLAALVLGLGVAFVPWHWLREARRVPAIHDITTDTERPPEFVAVLPLRKAAPNPATYGGTEVALAQREAYPDIRPLFLELPPARAFDRALAAARDMGWEIVAADSASGRIEATATTTWFGFKDDVVVRVAPAAAGSRVDVRSVSRVGQSDVGTNARRIRSYMSRLAS